MVVGLAVDVLPLIPTVVALGGGLRVGLEDAPFGTLRSCPKRYKETPCDAAKGAKSENHSPLIIVREPF